MRFRSSILCLSALVCSVGLAHTASAQIVNGDFSAGNTGFSTDYTPVATDGTVYTLPPDYGVISDPSKAFTNGYISFGDHTTGSGLMLFADGSGNAGDRVWYQTVSVTPNTAYTFSAFAATAGVNPPTLNFYSDASLLGALPVTAAPGVFQQFTDSFTTGNVNSIVFAIRDGNTTAYGNDFAIDDISLIPNVTATPEPGSIALLVGMGLSSVGILVRRKRARKTV